MTTGILCPLQTKSLKSTGSSLLKIDKSITEDSLIKPENGSLTSSNKLINETLSQNNSVPLPMDNALVVSVFCYRIE